MLDTSFMCNYLILLNSNNIQFIINHFLVMYIKKSKHLYLNNYFEL